MPTPQHHIQNAINDWFPTIADKVTAGTVIGAVSSPWWLKSLHDISEVAALLLPILGCTWFAVQIILKFLRG
jgi:hypothetical protein